MKDNRLSRRTFVKASSASLAALSLPAILTGCSNTSTESPAAAPPVPSRPEPSGPVLANAWEAGDANSFTRYYFDSLMLETRYLDSDIPSTKLSLFGETFDTPIMTAALSHLKGEGWNGMVNYTKAAAACNAVNWMGMGEDKDLEEVVATGARTVKIIKPYENNDEVLRRIRHAESAGCFAVGMDIDHSFNGMGGYDNVLGQPMKPKTTAELKSFVKATRLPFIVKGVLSVHDAKRCMEAGVAGIVLSHHGGRVKYAIPPLMALEQIAAVVRGKMKIFIDCGIVSGMDAYKCLALGADAVSVGRHLIPLMREGADPVAERLREMTAELAGAMSVTGVRNLKEMDPSVIHKTIL